ncbi:MAG: HAD hydrolase-like protein [Marinovum sp.]|nr:HAD hydrolase-like protein [Marinovum sp.]
MRIAFDLDGTLIDSVAHIHEAASRALAELTLPPVDLPTLQSFVGNGLPILVTRLIMHIGAEPSLHQELHDRTLAHYLNTPTDPQSLYPNVVDTLLALRGEGHSLTICTNRPFHAALANLQDTDLLHIFDLVIGGDSLPTRKPSPDMLLATAPDLYVGDSEVDAETAVAANIPFLLFTEGYRKSPVSEIPHTAAFDAWNSFLPLANTIVVGA